MGLRARFPLISEVMPSEDWVTNGNSEYECQRPASGIIYIYEDHPDILNRGFLCVVLKTAICIVLHHPLNS